MPNVHNAQFIKGKAISGSPADGDSLLYDVPSELWVVGENGTAIATNKTAAQAKIFHWSLA